MQILPFQMQDLEPFSKPKETDLHLNLYHSMFKSKDLDPRQLHPHFKYIQVWWTTIAQVKLIFECVLSFNYLPFNSHFVCIYIRFIYKTLLFNYTNTLNTLFKSRFGSVMISPRRQGGRDIVYFFLFIFFNLSPVY